MSDRNLDALIFFSAPLLWHQLIIKIADVRCAPLKSERIPSAETRGKFSVIVQCVGAERFVVAEPAIDFLGEGLQCRHSRVL
jgi:hypothetical protein